MNLEYMVLTFFIEHLSRLDLGLITCTWSKFALIWVVCVQFNHFLLLFQTTILRGRRKEQHNIISTITLWKKIWQLNHKVMALTGTMLTNYVILKIIFQNKTLCIAYLSMPKIRIFLEIKYLNFVQEYLYLPIKYFNFETNGFIFYFVIKIF